MHGSQSLTSWKNTRHISPTASRFTLAAFSRLYADNRLDSVVEDVELLDSFANNGGDAVSVPELAPVARRVEPTAGIRGVLFCSRDPASPACSAPNAPRCRRLERSVNVPACGREETCCLTAPRRAAPAFSRLPCRSLSDRRPKIGGRGDTEGVDIATGDGAGPRWQATTSVSPVG